MGARSPLIGMTPAMWHGTFRICVLIPEGTLSKTAPSTRLPSLALVEEDYGRHLALAVAQQFVPPSSNGNCQQKLAGPAVFNSQPADRFAELIPWVMRNLHEDFSVSSLARRICMSPSHFTRAFKSVFGSTPAQFVETLRINEAKRRLSVPKRTLDTIAASVGFSDPQTFRRAFERRCGTKPRRYLKNLNAPSTAASFKREAASTPAGREALTISAQH
jgi:transcriptional regulator GlxA family with amidase domain